MIEIFPSEAIWSLGVLGAYAGFDSATVRAYKARQPRFLDLTEADAVARRPLAGFLPLLTEAGLPERAVAGWVDHIATEAIRLAATKDGSIRKSKCFDDIIDSGIAFLTAASCAVGQFHQWGDGTTALSWFRAVPSLPRDEQSDIPFSRD